MALRAKKPVIKDERFKTVVYATRGVGKTHFCCSFPNTYFIDTEGLEAHPHFVEMLINNGSDIARINDLTEIISEVRTLLSTNHSYKTLVIDSITFPFHLLANMEAERLNKKSRDGSEGTEYGANLAKPKRLVFELGMLLSRLDMNVLVTSHEKSKYEKGVEIGKAADVNEKIEYALGSVINLRRQGKKVRAFIDKSRYPKLPTGDSLEFDHGYNLLCDLMGKEVFEKDSICELLATPEQIERVNTLIINLNVPEEWINKRLTTCRASSLETLNQKDMQELIDLMLDRVKIKGAK